MRTFFGIIFLAMSFYFMSATPSPDQINTMASYTIIFFFLGMGLIAWAIYDKCTTNNELNRLKKEKLELEIKNLKEKP